jgi:MFS family permease
VVAANVTFASAPRKVTGFGFGLDITGIALIGLSPTIAIVAGAVTAPRLVRLIGHERTIVTGCLIGFAGATAQAVWHYALWQWVIVIGVAAAGVGLIASAMSMALAERTDPTSTGIALGMLATVRAVGGSVASAGAGAILNSAISAETHFPREWAYVTVWFVIGGLTSLIAVPIVALSRLPAGPPTRPAP